MAIVYIFKEQNLSKSLATTQETISLTKTLRKMKLGTAVLLTISRNLMQLKFFYNCMNYVGFH